MRVMVFSKAECPFLNREHTWQEFYTFRNGVVDILSRYGSVGPEGKMPILATYEESLDERAGGTSDPIFLLLTTICTG